MNESESSIISMWNRSIQSNESINQIPKITISCADYLDFFILHTPHNGIVFITPFTNVFDGPNDVHPDNDNVSRWNCGLGFSRNFSKVYNSVCFSENHGSPE
jgi:hypothetical protein